MEHMKQYEIIFLANPNWIANFKDNDFMLIGFVTVGDRPFLGFFDNLNLFIYLYIMVTYKWRDKRCATIFL